MNRQRPRGSSGVLAALFIAPRTFCFHVCMSCMRELYYTYAGEECPHCGARVTAECFVEGELPEQAGGHRIDLRARSHEPGSGASAARRTAGRVARRGRGRGCGADVAEAAG